MQCYEVLGINESATEVEIDNAFTRKIEILYKSQDVLSPSSFRTKCEELNNAKENCKKWKSTTYSEKVKFRLQEETNTKKKSDVRLNGVCFGPCTFVDMCGGEFCRECGCGGYNEGCCENVCGSQLCPIILDGMLWFSVLASIGSAILPPIIDAIADSNRSRKEAKANQIRKTISNLNIQLEKESQQHTDYTQELEKENHKLQYMEKFVIFFENIGASETTSVLDEQKQKVFDIQKSISACHEVERDLRAQIEANKRLLNQVNK